MQNYTIMKHIKNNMKPKEKAIDLINKYNLVVLDTSLGGSNTRVKKCALIAVQERIDEGYEWMGGGNTEWEKDRYNYWQEVKQEIEKL